VEHNLSITCLVWVGTLPTQFYHLFVGTIPELIEDVPHDIIVPITFYTYGISYQYFIDLVGGSRHSALSIVFGEATYGMVP
jgi:hypothetical protein